MRSFRMRSISNCNVKKNPLFNNKNILVVRFEVLLYVLVSLAYSYFLSVYFLDFDNVTDRGNYIVHVLDAEKRFFNSDWSLSGTISFFANEPLWRFINYILSQFFDPKKSIAIYIFISSFVFAFSVFIISNRYNHSVHVVFIFALLCLLLPQVMKNFISHLRQGVAISLFLFSYVFLTGWRQKTIFLLMPFIHASFFFVIIILYLPKIFGLIKPSVGVGFTFLSFVFLMSGYISLDMASFLGAKQTYYELADGRVSGLGFIFWSCVFLIYIKQGSVFVSENKLALHALLFYISVYWFFPVAGRIFESVLIFVLIAALGLRSSNFYFCIFLYIMYFLYQWVPRIGQAGLGWAG